MISAGASYIWAAMTTAKLALLILSAATLAGCASRPSGPFTITNLKYGTVCGTAYQDVCTQTADIALDGKGFCIYDHQDVPCTWYGFSFDYDTRFDGIVLDCDAATDYKHDFGNPQGIVQRNATDRRYQAITLAAGTT